MITEDYCSPEVSKLLKEKGFDEPCKGLTRIILSDNDKPQYKVTHQMAMKFLRKKDVIIVIQPEYFNIESKCSAWGCDIWVNDNYEKVQGDFPSYEEAVDVALKYSLENLI